MNNLYQDQNYFPENASEMDEARLAVGVKTNFETLMAGLDTALQYEDKKLFDVYYSRFFDALKDKMRDIASIASMREASEKVGILLKLRQKYLLLGARSWGSPVALENCDGDQSDVKAGVNTRKGVFEGIVELVKQSRDVKLLESLKISLDAKYREALINFVGDFDDLEIFNQNYVSQISDIDNLMEGLNGGSGESNESKGFERFSNVSIEMIPVDKRSGSLESILGVVEESFGITRTNLIKYVQEKLEDNDKYAKGIVGLYNSDMWQMERLTSDGYCVLIRPKSDKLRPYKVIIQFDLRDKSNVRVFRVLGFVLEEESKAKQIRPVRKIESQGATGVSARVGNLVKSSSDKPDIAYEFGTLDGVNTLAGAISKSPKAQVFELASGHREALLMVLDNQDFKGRVLNILEQIMLLERSVSGVSILKSLDYTQLFDFTKPETLIAFLVNKDNANKLWNGEVKDILRDLINENGYFAGRADELVNFVRNFDDLLREMEMPLMGESLLATMISLVLEREPSYPIYYQIFDNLKDHDCLEQFVESTVLEIEDLADLARHFGDQILEVGSGEILLDAPEVLVDLFEISRKEYPEFYLSLLEDLTIFMKGHKFELEKPNSPDDFYTWSPAGAAVVNESVRSLIKTIDRTTGGGLLSARKASLKKLPNNDVKAVVGQPSDQGALVFGKIDTSSGSIGPYIGKTGGEDSENSTEL